ncbi:MAG: SRPBCC domain-containing protein [Bryobacteraceae bacterium]
MQRNKTRGNVSEKRNWKALATADAHSRRQMITRSVFGIGSVAIARAEGHETASESAGTKTIITVKAIHYELNFKASPQRIYEALLDSKEFTAFSGGRAAEIHREVGGSFSIFAGHIVGRNLELIPARRIVQAWRVVPWPEGVYSIVKFELQNQGSGTRVIFDHTGFPTDLAEHLESGWQENYWKALRSYLG